MQHFQLIRPAFSQWFIDCSIMQALCDLLHARLAPSHRLFISLHVLLHIKLPQAPTLPIWSRQPLPAAPTQHGACIVQMKVRIRHPSLASQPYFYFQWEGLEIKIQLACKTNSAHDLIFCLVSVFCFSLQCFPRVPLLLLKSRHLRTISKHT